MKAVPGIHVILLLILVAANFSPGQDLKKTADTTCRGYSHKLVFAETPEIQHPWHWGFTSTWFIHNELYVCVKDWFSLELSGAFLPKKILPGLEKDSWTTLTIKSPPLKIKVQDRKQYKIAGGLKFYNTAFILRDTAAPADAEPTVDIRDHSVALFAAQSYEYDQHFFNLFSSISFRSKGSDSAKTTRSIIFLIPGYRYQINPRWSFVFEYLMSNMMYMPINPQWENLNQEWISYMFYGFAYTRRHLVFRFVNASHYTFNPALIPLLSLGFKF